MRGSFRRDSILLKRILPIGAKEENLKRGLLGIGKGMCGKVIDV
jgi:hypothetical protein